MNRTDTRGDLFKLLIVKRTQQDDWDLGIILSLFLFFKLRLNNVRFLINAHYPRMIVKSNPGYFFKLYSIKLQVNYL